MATIISNKLSARVLCVGKGTNVGIYCGPNRSRRPPSGGGGPRRKPWGNSSGSPSVQAQPWLEPRGGGQLREVGRVSGSRDRPPFGLVVPSTPSPQPPRNERWKNGWPFAVVRWWTTKSAFASTVGSPVREIRRTTTVRSATFPKIAQTTSNTSRETPLLA